MGKKTGVRIVEGDGGKRAGKRKMRDDLCPICGSPGGKYKCEECGWGVEELGPEYSSYPIDPVTTMVRARRTFTEVKKENKDLKEKIESLIFNNQKFSELVEAMEIGMRLLRTEAGKKYVYRYEDGGWRPDGFGKKALRLKKKGATIKDINNQLREILRLIKRYKK